MYGLGFGTWSVTNSITQIADNSCGRACDSDFLRRVLCSESTPEHILIRTVNERPNQSCRIRYKNAFVVYVPWQRNYRDHPNRPLALHHAD